ncbi:MAG TPA: D-alanyl-D-alanine carboxypeptidase/D-alanyl-D-alanine-endopeptidase [Microscillaceae bacterium]|nr:D-alanyl-D-alanine carboxypeptidase/D-alanyl-D-alanine-endopeptidase [Microscillaceae bacterium]
MHSRFLFVFIGFLGITLLTCSQTQQTPEHQTNANTHVANASQSMDTQPDSPENIPNSLKTLINQMHQDPVMRHGTWAFSVQDIASGKSLVTINQHKTLNVASSLKTVTTAAALGILGSTFTFKTYLQYDGKLTNGILNGNLYVKGGGDPTIGSPLLKYSLSATLNQWVAAIKKAGIRQIKGKLIIDETLFEENVTPSGWIWADMGNYYAAPAGAINVLDNTYRLYFQPARRLNAKPKVLRTSPWIPRIKFINHLKTAAAGTGDNAYIHGAPYDNTRYINGTIPMGGTFSIKGSIPDPGFYLGVKLREKLIQSKLMTSKNKATTSRLLKLEQKTLNTQRKTIHTHQSIPLQKIVNWINLYSVNLYAEAVLKMIGVQQKQEGSTEAGVKAIAEYWQSKGVSKGGFHMQDGSGLAQSNGITAYQLAQIQRLAAKQSYFTHHYNSLPIAGVSGTLKNVGIGTRAQNNLRAKTGGMTRVIAFTGYYKNRSGKLRSFALAANQYNCKYQVIKAKLVRLMVAMMEL